MRDPNCEVHEHHMGDGHCTCTPDTTNTAPTPETDAQSQYPMGISYWTVNSNFARTLERQRNSALADNDKLQAALDEAQAACAAKDDAITNLQRLFGHHQMWPSLEISEARSSTCSQPILARLAAAEEDTKRLDWLERRSHDEINEIKWLNNIRTALDAARSANGGSQ